jgi:hypothetical protein
MGRKRTNALADHTAADEGLAKPAPGRKARTLSLAASTSSRIPPTSLDQQMNSGPPALAPRPLPMVDQIGRVVVTV